MTLYVESSAALSWLLGEPPGDVARRLIEAASEVFSSDLTLIECDRTIHRAETVRISAEVAGRTRERLKRETEPWAFYCLDARVVQRARGRFPREPVRSLDALHLATALLIRDIRPGLTILSLDRRVRENAAALGFPVIPAAS